jgi:hypothetical protein
MFWMAREEPNDVSRMNGCKRIPSEGAYVSPFSGRLTFPKLFIPRCFREEPLDTL